MPRADLLERLMTDERTDGARYLRQDAACEIIWLRSALVSLMVLAEATESPLTNEQVASICHHILDKE